MFKKIQASAGMDNNPVTYIRMTKNVEVDQVSDYNEEMGIIDIKLVENSSSTSTSCQSTMLTEIEERLRYKVAP